ncbi:MAG: hypothetical protein D8M59_14415 [Planctomycetes bacterium]|nr:hypothetical protein [Planctomycetota bacterium]NOG55524.1 M48 family metalloprotease [Planctomycetota bacterium]
MREVRFPDALSSLSRLLGPDGCLGLGTALYVMLGWFMGSIAVSLTRRLDRTGNPRAIRALDRATTLYYPVVLAIHLFNVYILDWLGQVRSLIGDVLLLDEFLVLLLPLVSIVALWMMQYPIIRRVREASLIRKCDAGEPVYPIWTMSQYVIAQARMHFALLLLPILLVLTWGEAIDFWWPFENGVGPVSAQAAQYGTMFLGVAVLFTLAPVLINWLWDTVPLAPGELRSRLEHLCVRHRIRVRRILVWRTGGAVVNAAVMGVFAAVRYVLMTDALLDSMNDDETEAVMAHEIGHVRRHHLPWLALIMLSLFFFTGTLATWGINTIAQAAYPQSSTTAYGEYASESATADVWDRVLHNLSEWVLAPNEQLPAAQADANTAGRILMWLELGSAGASLVVALLAFGWVSRRFERQADTFAVQHLSGMGRASDQDVLITPEATYCMCRALTTVSEQSHTSLTRKSWRHGSMAWRLAYLMTLPGTPCNQVSVDRQVRRIKLGALVLLILSAVTSYFIVV